jgi:hypothetical protein
MEVLKTLPMTSRKEKAALERAAADSRNAERSAWHAPADPTQLKSAVFVDIR